MHAVPYARLAAFYVAERICGVCSAAHGLGYCEALEQIAGVSAPPRARLCLGDCKVWEAWIIPNRCSIDSLHAPNAVVDALTWQEFQRTEILSQTKLQADKRHFFEKELKPLPVCTHIRLSIYPDGGVSRLRIYGTLLW